MILDSNVKFAMDFSGVSLVHPDRMFILTQALQATGPVSGAQQFNKLFTW